MDTTTRIDPHALRGMSRDDAVRFCVETYHLTPGDAERVVSGVHPRFRDSELPADTAQQMPRRRRPRFARRRDH